VSRCDEPAASPVAPVSVSFARRARTASPSRGEGGHPCPSRSCAGRGRRRRSLEVHLEDGETPRPSHASRARDGRSAWAANVAVTNERLHASRGRERRLAEEHFASTSSASDRRERGRSRWRTSRDHGSRVALRRTGGVSGRTRVRLVRAPREDGVALSRDGERPRPSHASRARDGRSAWAANVAVTNERLHASRGRERRLAESISRRPRQLPTGGREDEADGERRATTARVSRCDEPAASPVAPVSISFARRARTASPSRGEVSVSFARRARTASPSREEGHPCPSRSCAGRGRRRRSLEVHLEGWGEAARPSHASRARDGRSAWAANVAVTNERLHASRGRERRLCRRALRVDLVSFRPAGERTKQMADVARPRLACRAATNRRRLRSHPCPSRSRAARGRRRPLEGKGGHPCPSRSRAARGRRRPLERKCPSRSRAARGRRRPLERWGEATTVSRFACSRRTQCLGRERRGHERTPARQPRTREAPCRRAFRFDLVSFRDDGRERGRPRQLPRRRARDDEADGERRATSARVSRCNEPAASPVAPVSVSFARQAERGGRRATSARVSRCDEPAASPVAPVSVSFARRARTASLARGEGHPCPSRSCAGRGRRRRSLEVHLDGWREAATVSRFACSRRTQCLGRERRGHERTRITPRARRARARRARGRAPCGGACSRGASSGTCCRRARRRRRGST
jgi:hypothetical protein